MRLDSTNGHRFELRVIGYEFPNLEHDRYGYDRNWLQVELELRSGNSTLSYVDPCLLTWELIALKDWLASIAAGDVKQRRITFIEPTLSLTALQLKPSIVIRLTLTVDKLVPSPFDHSPEVHHLNLHATTEELRRAVAELSRMAASFPERPESAKLA